MNITWLKEGSFLIEDSKAKFLINPIKGLKTKATVNANILSNSIKSEYDEKRISEEGVYTVDWPGEYEIGGTLIEGIENPNTHDGGVHNVFKVTSYEGISVCHLGELVVPLPNDRINKLGSVDVLILPIEETPNRKLKDLKSLIDDIDPAIVVPCNYTSPAELEAFAKELGVNPSESSKNLKVTKTMLTAEGVSLMVLDPQS